MKDIEGIEKVLQVLETHWNEIHSNFDRLNQRFLKLASVDHDPIGRVLRAHLIIESFLDTFLSTFYGIDNVTELKLSFFQKAKLLPSKHSSAAFVRPGILQLNAVRNKFGHQLNHEIECHEVSAIFEVLRVARPNINFETPISAIEAFAPVSCAFLSVPPPHLQQIFMEAFANIRSYNPEIEV